jgi:hypothetical protein
MPLWYRDVVYKTNLGRPKHCHKARRARQKKTGTHHKENHATKVTKKMTKIGKNKVIKMK